MNIKIRQSVFETNSSSTHSISIAETNFTDLMDALIVNDEGNVVLTGGEFGWEYERYNDAESKANYAMIYAMEWSGENKDEFCDILKNVIKEQTGALDVIFEGHYEYWDKEKQHLSFGYIDHQSVEDNDLHFMFDDKEKLRQFIFNRASVLTTDNDNH